ncbi:MAG: septal ring lytic transglycosylase RlpA family protein [Acidobacteriia bacterium]|nr:septal ring lytic transglycosylase RlpA family protein [Terriglobia bacterium]
MRTVFAAVLIAVVLSGCGHKTRASRIPPPPAAVPVGYTETGLASWYGYPYHGRRAADGEIYDMEQLTAAHRTLPFNAWVRVFNLDNHRTVDVRITDRGPFVEGRVIDLSHAAAQVIQMIGPGTARVRLQVTRLPDTEAAGLFAVQVGAFSNRRRAERLRHRMESRYGLARVVERDGTSGLWRVLVGSEPTEDKAAALAQRIRKDSGENTPAFVVRVDAA